MSSAAEWQQLRDLAIECTARIEETGRYIREVRPPDAFQVYWRACAEAMGGWASVISLATQHGAPSPSNEVWREVLAARRGPTEVVTSLPTALAEVARVTERVGQLPSDDSDAAELAAELRRDLAELVVLLQGN